MADKRFVIEHKEGRFSGAKVIVDSETGVNYLFAWDGNAAGLTVLLNIDGKPIITKVYR